MYSLVLLSALSIYRFWKSATELTIYYSMFFSLFMSDVLFIFEWNYTLTSFVIACLSLTGERAQFSYPGCDIFGLLRFAN